MSISASLSIRTCLKCSAQHVLLLQKYKPGWQTQPHAVLDARPFFSKRLLRARHDVQRPWIAREVPLFPPDTILFSPSLTWKQREEGSTTSSRVRSCLGVWSNCLIKTHTYFQNKLPSCSSSFSSRHLGSKWRQARKESTKVMPSNFI